jgi:hypothetical protein
MLVPLPLRLLLVVTLGLAFPPAHAAVADAARDWDQLRQDAGAMAELARSSFEPDAAGARVRLAAMQQGLEERARSLKDRGLVVEGLDARLAYSHALLEQVAGDEDDIAEFERLMACVATDARQVKATLGEWEAAHPGDVAGARALSELVDTLVQRLHDVWAGGDEGVVSGDQASRESIRFEHDAKALVEAHGDREAALAASTALFFDDTWAALTHVTAVLESRQHVDELVEILEQIRDAEPVPFT